MNATKDEAKDLTTGNYKRQLTALAAPIIGTSFIQMAYVLTDMAWVGRLGNDSVAAIGVVGVLAWFVTSIGAMTKIGAEVRVAQALGAKDSFKAALMASHSTSIAIWLAGIMLLAGALFGPKVFALYGLEPRINRMAEGYLYLYLIGLVPYFLSLALSGCYNAAGHSRIPFKANATGLVLNMLLDPLCIFVFGWGIEGAALATILAETVVCGILLWERRFGKRILSGWKLLVPLRRAETLSVISVGLPVSLLNCCFSVISFTMGSFAARVGGAVGATVINTGGQIEALSWNTSQGFSTALSAFVGQNYSAGKKKRIWMGYRYIVLITGIIGLVATLLFVFLGNYIFWLIVPETAVMQEGGIYLRISGYTQLFMMAEITAQGLFYGTGNSTIPATVSVVGNILRIPMFFLFSSFGWGLRAVWWAVSLSAFLKGATALALLPYLKRKINRAIPHEAV